jgi:hypothetical protein
MPLEALFGVTPETAQTRLEVFGPVAASTVDRWETIEQKQVAAALKTEALSGLVVQSQDPFMTGVGVVSVPAAVRLEALASLRVGPVSRFEALTAARQDMAAAWNASMTLMRQAGFPTDAGEGAARTAGSWYSSLARLQVQASAPVELLMGTLAAITTPVSYAGTPVAQAAARWENLAVVGRQNDVVWDALAAAAVAVPAVAEALLGESAETAFVWQAYLGVNREMQARVEAGGVVSRSWPVPYAADAVMAAAGFFQVESLLSASRQAGLPYLSWGGVAAAMTTVLNTGGIVTVLAPTWLDTQNVLRISSMASVELLAGAARNGMTRYESGRGLESFAAGPVEAPTSPTAAAAAAVDALSRIVGTGLLPADALLAVVRVASDAVEAAAGPASAAAVPVDAQKTLVVLAVSPASAATNIAGTASAWVEWATGVTGATVAFYEAGGRLIATGTAVAAYEATAAVEAAAAAAHEATTRLVLVALLPWEGRQWLGAVIVVAPRPTATITVDHEEDALVAVDADPSGIILLRR